MAVKAISAIEEAKSALERLVARRQDIEERRQAAQARQDSAEDDVDEHVTASLEIQGCESALKHIGAQIAETQKRMEAAQQAENERRTKQLREEIEQILNDFEPDFVEVYHRITDEALLAKHREFQNLAGAYKNGEFENRLALIRKVALEGLRLIGQYRESQDANGRCFIKKVDSPYV